MSLAKTRKTMSFLTPQSRKIQSPSKRLSFSAKDASHGKLLGNLLNDPLKRALLMEVLSQDARRDAPDVVKKTLEKAQKFKLESPSALCRRRALEKMRLNSDSSDSSGNSTKQAKYATNVPFEKILKGVVVYVEIKSNNQDRSAGAKALMRAMGAETREVLSRDVTHVVFKDGCFKTYQKAKLLKVHLVSVLWVEAVRKSKSRVPEKSYPALGAAASDVNVSLICKKFQKEYADVIEEELNKTNNLSSSKLYSEDIVDTSQNFDLQSIVSVKSKAPVALTPNSLCLESAPEVTSDSEDDDYQKKRRMKRVSVKSEKSIRTDRSESQTENLSSLRISAASVDATEVTKTPSQPLNSNLNYKNVTQRKKKPVSQNNVNIVSDILIAKTPPKSMNIDCDVGSAEASDDMIKNLDHNLKEMDTQLENNASASMDQIISKPPRKIARKLYDFDDFISGLENELTSNSLIKKIDSANSVKENQQTSSRTKTAAKRKSVSERKNRRAAASSDEFEDDLVTEERESPIKSSVRTPRNFKISVKKALTTPRRRSVRHMQKENEEECKSKTGSDAEDGDVLPDKAVLVAGRPNSSERCTKAGENIEKETAANSRPQSTSDDGDSVPSLKRLGFSTPKPKNTIESRRRSTRLLSTANANHTQQPTQQEQQQQRRSTLDFLPKEPVSQIKPKTPRRRKSPKNTSIVCTRFHSTEVQVFTQIVKKLGVFFIEDEVTDKTTHLVAAECRRTVNLLRAIARGCWVLKSEWLYRSLEENRWLPEEDYEMREFSIAVQKTRQERQAFGPCYSMDVFADCGKIYVSRGTNPRCSDLQELVTLCKGTLTTILRNADIVVGEYAENKSCVTVAWILDCITFYNRKSLRKYLIEAPSSD